MAQDYKWKFFYNSSHHNIEDIIAFAEEEIIREESLDDLKTDINSFMSQIENDVRVPSMFFEDKGIMYGLSDNLYLHSKTGKKH